jgi:N-acetylmuramoyl-L-alanine amidase
MRSTAIRASALTCVLLAAVASAAAAQSARLRPSGSGAASPDGTALFKEAASREATLRRELSAAKTAASTVTQRRVRTLVGSYEDLARLFPAAGQADKALWQGAALSADLFFQAGDELDRERAVQLLAALAKAFPGSSYARQGVPLARRLEGAPRQASAVPAPAVASAPAVAAPAPKVATPAPKPAPRAQTGPEAIAMTVPLTAVRRELLPDAVRVTLDLGREVAYHSERIQGPDRVFVDLPHTRAVQPLRFAVLPFEDGVVRRVRIGAHPDGSTRVVLDLDGAGRHSVYTLYNPHRIVVDVERPATSQLSSQPPAVPVPSRTPVPPSTARAEPPVATVPAAPIVSPAAAAAGDIVASGPPPPPPPDTPPPATPVANARGGFSLSRQLGLGIARIVIDAGHGGHDPGARAKGLSEADLTLDVALRLEKLLLRQPGVEVIQTRRTNAFVPLEERTELANRSSADIFLSIHANASEDRRARGVETYYLNFAPTAEAEALAARENAASTRPMRQLPDIVRAITLNNKRDESRDLARLIQDALFAQVRKSDRRARNLGVKQAPFMVLVGAQMPSILTEISFLTNQQDAGLLATEKYRQQIAEALLAGITRYQQTLKKAPAVATQ